MKYVDSKEGNWWNNSELFIFSSNILFFQYVDIFGVQISNSLLCHLKSNESQSFYGGGICNLSEK